jgi:hypothetical protein
VAQTAAQERAIDAAEALITVEDIADTARDLSTPALGAPVAQEDGAEISVQEKARPGDVSRQKTPATPRAGTMGDLRGAIVRTRTQRQAAPEEKEEEVQTVRRRVDGSVLSQTLTEAAVRALTTIELRQQVALLERWPDLAAPQRENLTLLQSELQQREGALSAAGAAELFQECDDELKSLRNWMLMTGGLAQQTLRAYDIAVGNLADNTGDNTSGGLQLFDIFGVVLAAIPFAGPILRWVGQEALRQATVAVAQAAAGAAVSHATSLSEASTALEEQSTRNNFVAQARSASAVLADTLSRNTDGVLTAYRKALAAAQLGGDAGALRVLLVNLQHENDQVRLVSVEQYADLSHQFEIDLYRRYYRSRAYILETVSDHWGVHSRKVVGIDDKVRKALRTRLAIEMTDLEIAKSWGLTTRQEKVSGKPW